MHAAIRGGESLTVAGTLGAGAGPRSPRGSFGIPAAARIDERGDTARRTGEAPVGHDTAADPPGFAVR